MPAIRSAGGRTFRGGGDQPEDQSVLRRTPCHLQCRGESSSCRVFRNPACWPPARSSACRSCICRRRRGRSRRSESKKTRRKRSASSLRRVKQDRKSAVKGKRG